MDEGQAVEILVTQTSILLAGVGVFFSVISVYLAGLNYFLAEESRFTKFLAFLFVTIALVMVMAILYGAQIQHAGLIASLGEIEKAGNLSPAGRAALGNFEEGFVYAPGHVLTIDEAVIYFTWGAGAVTYIALFYLTFFYRWRGRANLRDMP
jgi:O-antigen/teichoic acid export membrane protein